MFDIAYPCSFILDCDFLVPMTVNGDQGLFAQHDSAADSVRELATTEERLKPYFKFHYKGFFH